MTKKMLSQIMHKNYNLPTVTALAHSALLSLLMTGLIICAYVVLSTEILSKNSASSLQILDLHRFFWMNKAPLVIGVGILLGLNELVYYLLFRLGKKPVAYSCSAVVLALQVVLIVSGISVLY